MLCRTETESYTLSTVPTPNGMSYSIIRCFRPGSVFRFYVLARFHLDKIPPLVRLGKLMAKAEIVKQYPITTEVAEGDHTASSLLNWDDMAIKPSLCDVIVYALPGRLIENAKFVQTRHLRARFVDGEEVCLPLKMGYFRKELCSSWLENTV